MSLDRAGATAAPEAELSLMEASALVAAGDLRPTALTETMLARIARHDGALKSYMTVMADQAMAAAEVAEKELAAGLNRGPLHGIPIAVKDLCRTTDAPTSAGMAIHRAYMAEADSTVVARLRAAGAVLLGKLAMTEGAFAGHHPDLVTPLNPWNAEVWTGASSSGSGAATAAGLCFGSLGSDTGGSIRFPSHACGVTGLKGTWGRVSRAGVFALADSLDHVGPMARTARDCAAMMGVLAGPDPRDPTALPDPAEDYLAACAGPIGGLRIGLDRAHVFDGTDPQVAAALEAAIEVFRSLGARIVPVELPSQAGLQDAWDAICGVEVVIAHQGDWPERASEYGPSLGNLLKAGAGVSGLQLGQAMQRRLVYAGAYATATEAVDMVLLPVLTMKTPLAGPWAKLAAGEAEADPDWFASVLKHTAPADMTGLPALTLPGGFDDRGAPIGFQLVGRRLGEAALLRAGHAFQTRTDHHVRRPDLTPFG